MTRISLAFTQKQPLVLGRWGIRNATKKYFTFDDNEWTLDLEVLTVHSVPAAGRHQAMVQIHCAGLSVQQDCGKHLAAGL